MYTISVFEEVKKRVKREQESGYFSTFTQVKSKQYFTGIYLRRYPQLGSPAGVTEGTRDHLSGDR
jgi:hypothetical protein